GRRVTPNGTWWWAAVPIAAGVVPVVGALLLTGLVPLKGIALVPVAGILIGGALTATVLGGRRALDELGTRHGGGGAGGGVGLAGGGARPGGGPPPAGGAPLPGLDPTPAVGGGGPPVGRGHGRNP
ncbi:ABC transporter permease, partial [Streptomyces noursei]|uniref:ABC transporter permease n=1 Tax=Streptomyces noursei TaxID=1971 RepID=UPI000B1D0AF4